MMLLCTYNMCWALRDWSESWVPWLIDSLKPETQRIVGIQCVFLSPASLLISFPRSLFSWEIFCEEDWGRQHLSVSYTLALCRPVEGRNPFRLKLNKKKRAGLDVHPLSKHRKDMNARTLAHEDLGGLGEENKTQMTVDVFFLKMSTNYLVMFIPYAHAVIIQKEIFACSLKSVKHKNIKHTISISIPDIQLCFVREQTKVITHHQPFWSSVCSQFRFRNDTSFRRRFQRGSYPNTTWHL